MEQLKTAFGVSRLVMLTGANLRSYQAESDDDQVVLERLKKALPAILSPQEIASIESSMQK